MSMKIRLARGGSKKRPFYSIVATDSRMPRDGRFLEKLGIYNPLLAKVELRAKEEGAQVVAVCAAIEAEISQLDDADRKDFLDSLGLDEPGLNRVIRAGYALLGLQTYFTAGVKEVRAWTVRAGSTAPQAAGVIHTDFERGFIRAETMAYDDFITYKGEAGAKEAGKLRLEGKEYIVREGDVLHFRFNV